MIKTLGLRFWFWRLRLHSLRCPWPPHSHSLSSSLSLGNRVWLPRFFSLISLDTRSLLGSGFIGGRFAFAASREGHLPRRELCNYISSTKTWSSGSSPSSKRTRTPPSLPRCCTAWSPSSCWSSPTSSASSSDSSSLSVLASTSLLLRVSFYSDSGWWGGKDVDVMDGRAKYLKLCNPWFAVHVKCFTVRKLKANPQTTQTGSPASHLHSATNRSFALLCFPHRYLHHTNCQGDLASEIDYTSLWWPGSLSSLLL